MTDLGTWRPTLVAIGHQVGESARNDPAGYTEYECQWCGAGYRFWPDMRGEPIKVGDCGGVYKGPDKAEWNGVGAEVCGQ